MALRFRVVSEHAIRLGEQSTKVFGVHGGTIGRATDNEWILPDPERYLSGKHARVDFRAGTYVLVDTSSNGTYVNGAQVPLGKYHDYLLKDGDYVRLGEYELLVSIDKSNDFPPEESAIVAYDGKAASSAVSKSTANDLGADLDLSQLLEPSDLLTGDSGVRPRDAYGQALPGAEPPMQTRAELEADAAGTPWHMMTRPLKVEGAKAEGLPAPPVRARQNPVLVRRRLRRRLDCLLPRRRHRSAPHLDRGPCRGAAAGRPAAARSRARFDGPEPEPQRISQSLPDSAPANDGPESPLNFSRGVDEALVRLLTTTSTRAGSVEAIRQNFRELKAQNTATLSATRAAFEEFLGRVDPKELEERFERGTKRGVFGSQNKAKFWDLYAEMFAGLVQRPADGFPHLFTETFAKAFEAKLRALVPPRRSSFGADRGEPGAEERSDRRPVTCCA